MSKPTLLVVAAHPDDEVLGCGATIALRKDQGWNAHVLILTGGVGGRYSKEEEKKSVEVAALQKKLAEESISANEMLEVNSVTRLDFPDNRLDTVPLMDVAQAISKVIENTKPDTIFVHHPGDYNWDHRIAYEALMMAARRNPGDFSPREILCYEVLSSTERSWQRGETAFCPTVFVDVKKTIEKKKSALQAYRSEYRPYPHPRSKEGVEYAARKRGLEVGIEYAEAFALVRRVEE